MAQRIASDVGASVWSVQDEKEADKLTLRGHAIGGDDDVSSDAEPRHPQAVSSRTHHRGTNVGCSVAIADKAALAAAKAGGVKLGNPNGARARRGKQVGNKQAVAAVKANAEHRAANLRGIVDDIRSQDITSLRAIAAELNERGILNHAVALGMQRLRLAFYRGCKPNR